METSKSKSLIMDTLLIGASAGLILWANVLVFLIVPNERVMGPVQRIFYFHVGSAVACYLACAALLIGSLGYLATRGAKFDVLGHAAAEVGFVFCTIVLFTGMIWGHSAWNTWFRWEEPRLVTFLLLWLIFLSLNLFRKFGDPHRAASHAAVLGILGALTVPLVYFSVKILPQNAQLHPQVVEHGGLHDPSYWTAFFVAMGALSVLQFLFLWIRYRIGLAALEVK